MAGTAYHADILQFDVYSSICRIKADKRVAFGHAGTLSIAGFKLSYRKHPQMTAKEHSDKMLLKIL